MEQEKRGIGLAGKHIIYRTHGLHDRVGILSSRQTQHQLSAFRIYVRIQINHVLQIGRAEALHHQLHTVGLLSVFAGFELRIVSRQAHQQGGVASGGGAVNAHPAGVDSVFRRMGSEEADGGFGILQIGREGVSLHGAAVIDGGHHVAHSRQLRKLGNFEIHIWTRPGAALHKHHQRPGNLLIPGNHQRHFQFLSPGGGINHIPHQSGHAFQRRIAFEFQNFRICHVP